jgi:Fur family ferric uptake transcriptional regulator
LPRSVNYNTKKGEAVLACLAARKNIFVTAAQIAGHLQKQQVAISRPTIYRQLEKLVRAGRVRKYLFDGASVSSFQYVDGDEYKQDGYHLKCEVCQEMFKLNCDEAGHFSRHILEAHAFKVNDGKTIFYGKCLTCLEK